MGYALTVAMVTLAKPLEQCTKLHVKVMAATASILENHSDTSKNESRSI
jgi:hypothetical protein